MPAAATLASLPAEIQTRIAAMCALQDRRFTHAKLALDTDTTYPVADPPSYVPPVPSTVGALSVLSKYWNQVSEPYRFSVRQAYEPHLQKVFRCNG